MEFRGYAKVDVKEAEEAAKRIIKAINIIDQKERDDVERRLRSMRFTWNDVWFYDNVGFIDYYFRRKRYFTEEEIEERVAHLTCWGNFSGEKNKAKAIIVMVKATNTDYIYLSPDLSLLICYSHDISLDELEKMSYSEAYKFFKEV